MSAYIVIAAELDGDVYAAVREWQAGRSDADTATQVALRKADGDADLARELLQAAIDSYQRVRSMSAPHHDRYTNDEPYMGSAPSIRESMRFLPDLSSRIAARLLAKLTDADRLAIISEEATARNMDSLDLTGTHYQDTEALDWALFF